MNHPAPPRPTPGPWHIPYTGRVPLTSHDADIRTLRPHPRNARNGDVDAIEESLRINGQYRPVVIARDGTILAGNHTYAAALALGWHTLSVVTLDLDPHDPRALRIMLADNRTADLGRYDEALLLSLIFEVGDLDGTGWDEDAVRRLTEDAGGPFQPDDQMCPTCGRPT